MRLMRKSTLPAGSPGAFNEIYQGWASAEAEIAPGSRWKPSRYNYVSRFDDGVAIVYNMASDAVFALGPEDGEMLALLEDGIVAPQTGGTADYVHDNVLRAVLSESVDGDNLGLLGAGQSIQRSFDAKAAIPASGKYHFLAYVIDADKDQINTVTSSSTGQ